MPLLIDLRVPDLRDPRQLRWGLLMTTAKHYAALAAFYLCPPLALAWAFSGMWR